MKTIQLFFLISLYCLQGCKNEMNFNQKFQHLKQFNYSKFEKLRIVNRKGVYFVTLNGVTYKVEMSFFKNKIASIEPAKGEIKNASLTKKDKDLIENALKYFDRIGVLTLSVDDFGNVFLSIPFKDKCTYHLLKLSKSNSLKDLKKLYYDVYEDNWYLDKECSE